MKWINDYRNKSIRITNERMAHIMEHPEMTAMEERILETLQKPELVLGSLTDETAYLTDKIKKGKMIWNTK